MCPVNAWPERPIRLIMPFSPGGATDANARALAIEMETFLGQTLVVDNRGGANGIIGSDLVAKAAPESRQSSMPAPPFAIAPLATAYMRRMGECVGLNLNYSTLMPVDLTTLAHIAVSLRTFVRASSIEIPAVSEPPASTNSFTSGLCRTFTTSP